MKYRTFIILPVLLFLFSCSGTKKQNTDEPANAMELKTEDILFPASEVLNLKSYYLSATFLNDSLNLLYGYNYKSHALDCIDLNRRQLSQIPLSREGESAVMRDMCGLYIQAPDSIWLYDGSQRILLINSQGKLLKAVDLRQDLKESEQVLINTNHAMSTAHLFYDRKHNSLLYGIKDFSTSPISFRVRKLFWMVLLLLSIIRYSHQWLSPM